MLVGFPPGVEGVLVGDDAKQVRDQLKDYLFNYSFFCRNPYNAAFIAPCSSRAFACSSRVVRISSACTFNLQYLSRNFWDSTGVVDVNFLLKSKVILVQYVPIWALDLLPWNTSLKRFNIKSRRHSTISSVHLKRGVAALSGFAAAVRFAAWSTRSALDFLSNFAVSAVGLNPGGFGMRARMSLTRSGTVWLFLCGLFRRHLLKKIQRFSNMMESLFEEAGP